MKKLLLIVFFALALTGCKKDEGGGGDASPLIGIWKLEYAGIWHHDSIFRQFNGKDEVYLHYIRYIEFDEDSVFIYDETHLFLEDSIKVESNKLMYILEKDTIRLNFYSNYICLYNFKNMNNILTITHIPKQYMYPNWEKDIALYGNSTYSKVN